MLTLYLIQCGRTEYQEESRLQGRLSLPLSAVGLEQCESAVRKLADVKLSAIYAPADEACEQTAKLLVRDHRGAKVRKTKGLAELDLGLWQGALASEIERRQPKVYRKWREEPTTVTPPQGESIQAAFERVSEEVEAIVARHADKGGAVALVAPPVAAALVRCHLGDGSLDDIWGAVTSSADAPETFEVAPAADE